MGCKLSICWSSQFSHEIHTLIAFSEGMLNRETSSSQNVFNILNKNNIDVELRCNTRDEVYGEEGVWVAHQFFNSHVYSQLEPLVNCRKFSQQNIFGVVGETRVAWQIVAWIVADNTTKIRTGGVLDTATINI